MEEIREYKELLIKLGKHLNSEDSLNLLISRIYKKIATRKECELDDLVELLASSMSDDEIQMVDEFINSKTREELIDILYDCEYSSYSIYGGGHSSNDLSDLAIELLDLEAGDMVSDIGCGSGRFLAQCVKKIQSKNQVFKDIYGVEINNVKADITAMVLSCLDGFSGYRIEKKDVFTNEISPIFNKAYCYTPFGIKPDKEFVYISKRFGFKFTPRVSSEWIFIDKLLSANPTREYKIVAVLPRRTLFSSQDKQYRDLLIKEGLINSIIELPDNVLDNTSTAPVIVILSPNNTEVKVLDASEMYFKSRLSRANVLDVNRIIKEFKSKNCKKIGNKEIINFSNLTPSALSKEQSYQKYCKGKDLVKISDVADLFVGSQYTMKNFLDIITSEPTGYKILTSSDIEDGIVDWKNLPNIEYKDNKFDKYAIHKGDIVLTSKSSKYKTVVVDIEPEEKILVTGGMLIIRPNLSKINPTYLKIFLDSNDGRLAIERIQKGAYIKTINVVDLREILIPVLSKEKQNELSYKYNMQLSTLFALRKEIERVQDKLETLFSDEMED